MRISDWSSDVCSSDLAPQPVAGLLAVPVPAGDLPVGLAATRDAAGTCLALPRAAKRPHRPDDRPAATGGDRKSVGKGKSVSVRVDIGGRRILKKKHHANKKQKSEKIIH